MTRALNSSTSQALSGSVVYPAILVDLTLSDQTIRLTSLKRDLVYNGQTYVSNGWLLPVDGVQETTDVGNFNFDLTLTGISTALISLTLANQSQAQRGSVYLALLDSSGEVVGTPILLYRGLIDTVEIDDKIDNPTAVIRLENDLARFDTSQNYRFTNDSHTTYYPDDRGFEYVDSLEDWTGFWGRSERPAWSKRKQSSKKNG